MQRLSLRAAFVLVLFSGCQQKLGYEGSFSVDPSNTESFKVDGPVKEQKIKITATATGAPVDLYVVLEKDYATAWDQLKIGRKPGTFLAHQQKAQDASLEVTIPAKSDFRVIISGAHGKSTVKVKAVSQ